jgi:hypothetical protein
VNFYRDLAATLRAALSAKGYMIPATADDDDIVDGYLSVVNRQISVQPRTFHTARELNCPPELAPGYQELKRKVEAGESLKPHQNTSINRPDYYDVLYLDWKIQHFHLKATPHRRQAGFVERSGPLLFALVTDTDFYAIQVYEHGAWSKQELIEIFDRNWPKQLDPFRLKGVRPLGKLYTDDDVSAFRRVGITSLAVAGDSLIAPMGGGFRSNGQSSRIRENRANLVSICKEFDEMVKPLLAEFAAHSGPPSDRQQVSVERRGPSLVAVERWLGTDIASIEWPIKVDLQ